MERECDDVRIRAVFGPWWQMGSAGELGPREKACMGRRMTQEQWGELRQRLKKSVGQNNYTTWIEPLRFRDLQDGVATFDVPTTFLGNYVSQNFADTILHEMGRSGVEICRLNFKVAAN